MPHLKVPLLSEMLGSFLRSGHALDMFSHPAAQGEKAELREVSCLSMGWVWVVEAGDS